MNDDYDAMISMGVRLERERESAMWAAFEDCWVGESGWMDGPHGRMAFIFSHLSSPFLFFSLLLRVW